MPRSPWTAALACVVLGHLIVGLVAIRRWTPGAIALWAGLLALEAVPLVRSARTTREKAHGEHRYRSMVQNATDLVAILDADGAIKYASPSVETLAGRSLAELIGTPFVALVYPEDLRPVRRTLVGSIGAEEAVRSEFRLATPDGGSVHLEGIWSDLLDDPAVRGIVVNARDITSRKQLEAQLAHQAFHDPLTNLPNRSLLEDRVTHELTGLAGEGRALALLYVDLDGFKTVNDSLGHGAGDELLLAVAQRLAGCIRSGDTIARLGGDEFALLLSPRADVRSEAAQVAQRAVDTLSAPFSIREHEIFIGASVGVALAHSPDHDASDLIRDADLAMYKAKNGGKGRYEIFRASMQEEALQRLETRADLQRALDEGGLAIHYQPIVTTADGRIAGVEALVRWPHEFRGLLPPAEFIPVAEDSGLIVDIGQFVLEEACWTVRTWQRTIPGMEDIILTVNLSPRQFGSPDLVERVRMAIRAADLSAGSLVLEITESAMLGDLDAAIETMAALKELGVRIAIDDFGTGYSSLNYLCRLPLDILKIDRSFVDALGTADESAAVAEVICRLGQTLRVPTIAEGIEEVAQMEAVREMGCDMVQGYLLAEPLSAADARRFLAEHSAAPPAEPGAAPMFPRRMAPAGPSEVRRAVPPFDRVGA